ncbi:MAG: thioredoxin domain-containing protein [Candidatus Taylorbacteria bacterium]
MNTKRIIFWLAFIIILALIVWGMIIAVNKPQTKPGLSTPAPISSTDHVRGPADAKVTLIEYSDFQCPKCGMYYPVIEKVFAESSTTLRMVYRHFPLPQHQNARLAAAASEAASNQGKFWDMYSLIFANQSEWSTFSDVKARETFQGYATKIGLDIAMYTKDLDSDAVKAQIDADQADGEKIGVNSTPTFFVNGKAIVNPQGYDAFKKIIDEAAR